MEYVLTFLEGVIAFISPCLLPMLPIYLVYFTGRQAKGGGRKRALSGALGFVLGFTLLFVGLGALSGLLGGLLVRHRRAVEIAAGAIVMLFGLHYMDVLRLPFLNAGRTLSADTPAGGFWPSVVFGVIFAVSWTPCVGVFLGSALMLAASQGDSLRGVALLLSFSMGLGIPFVASALLIDRLESSFAWIKRHYTIITRVSGALLIAIGLAMATGLLGKLLNLLSL